MNRIVIIAVLLASLFLGGWGGTGHKIINKKSVESFPAEMSIFNYWAAQLEANASEADYRKGSDPNEAPKHYIDIDNYPEFLSTGRIQQSFDSVIAIYGYSFVIDQGILPWAITTAVDSIQKAFERRDWKTAVLLSADLGHYVADGHNPLHITRNYNGQFTGQNGIHSRYESSMINTFQSQILYSGDSISHIEDVNEYVFSFLYFNYSYLDSVLAADREAKTAAGNTNSTDYYQKLWEHSKAFTVMLFKNASRILAELIYTSWKNAGSPQITTDIKNDFENLLIFNLQQNYPNPFNPITKIKYTIPSSPLLAEERGRGEVVSLRVYDVLGNEVATLVNEEKPAGEYEVEFEGSNLSSGVYFYRLKAGEFIQTQKMILMR